MAAVGADGSEADWMEPWMEPFARTLDAAQKYVVSSTREGNHLIGAFSEDHERPFA